MSKTGMQSTIHCTNQFKLFPVNMLIQYSKAVLRLALRDFGMLGPDSDILRRASSRAWARKIQHSFHDLAPFAHNPQPFRNSFRTPGGDGSRVSGEPLKRFRPIGNSISKKVPPRNWPLGSLWVDHRGPSVVPVPRRATRLENRCTSFLGSPNLFPALMPPLVPQPLFQVVKANLGVSSAEPGDVRLKPCFIEPAEHRVRLFSQNQPNEG